MSRAIPATELSCSGGMTAANREVEIVS